MVKEVIRAPKFEEKVRKLDESVIGYLKKLIAKIIENPEIGKPMRFDRKGTREVYINPFRLSYAYNKNEDTVTLLDFYHKDEQ